MMVLSAKDITIILSLTLMVEIITTKENKSDLLTLLL